MQKISQNFFDLFGIPESFTVDLELIGEKYRALQTKVHPDRFADAGEQEKLAAVQYSSYLNDAFGTLVSPIKRAAYMLMCQWGGSLNTTGLFLKMSASSSNATGCSPISLERTALQNSFQ